MKRKHLVSVLIAFMFAVAILVVLIEHRNARPVIGATSSAPNATEEPAHVLPRQLTRPETATSPEGLTGVEYERYFIERRKIDPAFEWKHPINFWGRVLDEANGPVQGAAIRFEWNDTSSKGTSRETVLSDEDGNFTLLNKKGKGLTVSASKDGYYAVPGSSSRSFEYASPWDNRFLPDPNHRVVFRLRKFGRAEPLEVRNLELALSNNLGTTGFNPLIQKLRPEGPLLFQLNVSPRDEQRHSDYILSISNQAGGLKSTDEEFPFTAPEADYDRFIQAGMERDDPEWTAGVKGQFYFYIGEPHLYGRCRYELLLSSAYTNSVSTLVLTYWINRSGSRNLEADQFKYILRTPDYLLK